MSYRFLLIWSALEFSSLEVKYDTFRHRDEGTWQRHSVEYSQHNIADPYASTMYQTSCKRKKPSRWNSINTHTHTRKLQNLLPRTTLTTIYTAFYIPHLDYEDILYNQVFNSSFHDRLESIKRLPCNNGSNSGYIQRKIISRIRFRVS